MTSISPDPLIPLRAAVVLLLSLTVGITAGGLTYLIEQTIPPAVLYGGGATGAAAMLFHTLVGR